MSEVVDDITAAVDDVAPATAVIADRHADQRRTTLHVMAVLGGMLAILLAISAVPGAVIKPVRVVVCPPVVSAMAAFEPVLAEPGFVPEVMLPVMLPAWHAVLALLPARHAAQMMATVCARANHNFCRAGPAGAGAE